MAQQTKKGLGKANPVAGYTNLSGVDVYAQGVVEDSAPSSIQPPGVDKEPQSLEEALTGK